MKLNTNSNQQDLQSIFILFDKLNDDFKKIAREILKIETDKNLLSKPSMFIFSIINRAIALNKGFKSLAELNNYVAAINFLRLQADNCMRLFAMTLVQDRGKFFDSVENGEHIRNMKDCENRKMTDKLLSDELDKLFPGFRTLYENTSGLIHFSKEHINQNHQTTVNDNSISGEILFNGEHFFSIYEKVDYSYNMFLVSTELYKLIQGYKLHINEFLKDY
jgi:hypothetical protein